MPDSVTLWTNYFCLWHFHKFLLDDIPTLLIHTVDWKLTQVLRYRHTVMYIHSLFRLKSDSFFQLPQLIFFLFSSVFCTILISSLNCLTPSSHLNQSLRNVNESCYQEAGYGSFRHENIPVYPSVTQVLLMLYWMKMKSRRDVQLKRLKQM